MDDYSTAKSQLSYGIDTQTRYQQADTRVLQSYCAILEALVPVAIEGAINAVLHLADSYLADDVSLTLPEVQRDLASCFDMTLCREVQTRFTSEDGRVGAERLFPILTDILM